jgi:hypothetical protein
VSLVLDTGADSASVVMRGGEVLETIHFGAELGIDVRSTASSPITVCMTARGYGDSSCMSFNSVISIGFASGRDTVSLELLPLGQIKR